MAEKRLLCAFGIDLDAVDGWLGSYGGEDSPDDISRGMFAGEVGTPHLLKLFDRLGIRTTWFIPGHSEVVSLAILSVSRFLGFQRAVPLAGLAGAGDPEVAHGPFGGKGGDGNGIIPV